MFWIVNGSLDIVTEPCIAHAEKVFRRRAGLDTNPQIVQMVGLTGPINHWYYKSEEWIDQPFPILAHLIQPYVGPAGDCINPLYREYIASASRWYLDLRDELLGSLQL
jgi:hypothetical protein